MLLNGGLYLIQDFLPTFCNFLSDIGIKGTAGKCNTNSPKERL